MPNYLYPVYINDFIDQKTRSIPAGLLKATLAESLPFGQSTDCSGIRFTAAASSTAVLGIQAKPACAQTVLAEKVELS